MSQKRRISIELTPQEHAAITALARADDRSLRTTLVRLVREHIKLRAHELPTTKSELQSVAKTRTIRELLDDVMNGDGGEQHD